MDNPAEKTTQIFKEDVVDERIYNGERKGSVQLAGINQENLPAYHTKETRRILRKVDFRLLPLLTLLYVIAFLDRGNIGNAKVANGEKHGLLATLGMTDNQYDIALTVFFFPYAFFEVPSNIVLKLLRPSRWITVLIISWGCTMIGQGFVTSYGTLCATRAILGLCESGFFPAATYLVTTWYCRYEVQTRLAVFFSAASMAGAFSGLLAFAIETMDGVSGLHGWQWIFIIEGIVTVGIGIACPFILPDSPATAKFLTHEEKEFIRLRLEQDAGTSAGKVHTTEGFQWRYLKAAALEWKIYAAIVVYWGNSIVLYGFTYSAPSIILDLGYTAAKAQLLTIPIYVLGVISTIFFAVLADRYKVRWPFIVMPFSIAAAGLIALLAIPHPKLPGLTYAFLFCIPAGVYPPLIGILTWVANNLSPSWKRAVGMAILISIGNLGGAVGSNIFLARQAPHYWLGYGFALGIVTAAICTTFVLRSAYGKVNRERDLVPEEETRARYTDQELLDLGDKSPLYRYTL